MRAVPSELVLTALTLTVVPAHAQGDFVRLMAGEGARYDRFGASVALAGDLAVVGAPGRDSDDDVFDAGAIYVYDIETGVELLEIEDPSGSMFENLGEVLAASGSTIAAGVANDSHVGAFAGSVRFFDAKTGSPAGFFVAPDFAPHDHFGTSVALRGDLLVVGSPGDDDKGAHSGSAYVFDTTTGQLLHKLVAPDGASGDSLGISVAIGQGTILVGAGSSDVGLLAGAVYVFDLQTGVQTAKIQPATNRPWDFFGSSIATTGPLAAISAHGDRPGNEGALFVYDVATGAQVAELFASDAQDHAYFGRPVAAHGDLIVAGSPPWGQLGRAYVFDATTGNELLAVTPSTVSPDGYFGRSVAINDRALLIGAPYSRGGRGEVYARRIKD